MEQQRRRKYIINPLQVKLALSALILFAASIFTIWWEVVGDLKDLQASITKEFAQPELAYRIQSYSELITLGVLYKAVFVMIVIWLVVIVISHHFVGPIYRLKVCLKSIQDGDLACRMRLRKRDLLTDVEKSFNDMAAALQERSGQPSEKSQKPS